MNKTKYLLLALFLVLTGCSQNTGDSTGATPVLTVKQGGTSTSTAPGVGKMLIGNGQNYDLVSSSTLGMSRSDFSNTATGLSYSTTTGVTALSAGYVIPLSASTTAWNGFYNTPSTVITAGTGLQWSGNTLNNIAVAGGSTTTIAVGATTVNGPSFTFSTSSDTNIGLTIVPSGSTLTYTPTWIGTLGNARIASSSYWKGYADFSSTATGLTYTSATGAFSLTSGYVIPLSASTSEWATTNNTVNANSTNWTTAYTDRLKWDGGSTGLVAATGRTSLGLTDTATIASTTFYLASNPSSYITASALVPYLSTTTAVSTYITQASTSATYITQASTSATYSLKTQEPWGATTTGAIWYAGTGARVGVGTSTFAPSTIIAVASSSPSYLQMVMTNTSQTATSSVDYVAANSSSTDTTWYTAFGQNSSGWGASNWTINGKNDGYLYTNGGNLSVGTASSSTYLNFFTGGTLAANERMRIDTAGNVAIGTTTASARLDIHGAGTTSGMSLQTGDMNGVSKFTVYDSGTTTIGTTTTTGLLNVAGMIWSTIVKVVNQFWLPFSASLTTATQGEMGIDTTSGQLRYNDGTSSRVLSYEKESSLIIASTTLQAISGTSTATTTINLAAPKRAEQWTDVYCITDTGTSTVYIGTTSPWAFSLTCGPSGNSVSNTTSLFNARALLKLLMFNTSGVNQTTITTTRTIQAD